MLEYRITKVLYSRSQTKQRAEGEIRIFFSSRTTRTGVNKSQIGRFTTGAVRNQRLSVIFYCQYNIVYVYVDAIHRNDMTSARFQGDEKKK